MAIEKVISIKADTSQAKQGIDDLSKSGKQLDNTFKSVDATFEEVYGDLKPLTARMGEAEDRLYELTLAGKTTSKEYKALLDAVANYRKVQIQTDMVVDASATTLGQKLGGASQIAGVGIQGVTSAMGLMGTESQKVNEALLKVQSAMALSDAIANANQLKGQWYALSNAIKNTTVVQKLSNTATAVATTLQKAFTGAVNTTSFGFKSLKLAIASTGIGLLVVGIGSLIQNFDKVKAVIFKVIPSLETIGKTITNITNKVTDFLGITSEVERKLDKQKEYAEKALKQNEKYLKANEHKLTEAQKREIELNNEHFERVKSGEFTKEQSLKILREKTAKDRKEKLEEQNKIELEKQKELQEKRKAKLEEQRQKEIEIANKKIEDEKQRQESILNINQDYAKKLEDLEADTELKKIELEKKRALDELDRLKANKEERVNVELYYERLKNDELNRLKEEEKQKEEEDIKIKRQNNLDLLNEEQDLAKQKIETQKKVLDDLTYLAGAETQVGRTLLLAKQGIAVKELLIEAKKTLAFSKTAVAKSIVAVNEGTAQTAKVGFPQNIPLLIGYAAQAVGIISAIKSATQTANNVAGSLGVSGGGGDSGGSPPAPPSFNLVQGTGTNQIAEGLAKQNKPLKAYVVASEVSSQQSLERNIQNTASI